MLQQATTKPAADSGTTKLHQRNTTQSVTTAALKQNLQCHKSRWFGFLHPREFFTSCWQATTHSPVLNRSAWRRSGRKGVVGFLAEPGMMPKAAKRLSCFLLAYFTSAQGQLSRTCLVGAFLSPELIPVPESNLQNASADSTLHEMCTPKELVPAEQLPFPQVVGLSYPSDGNNPSK